MSPGAREQDCPRALLSSFTDKGNQRPPATCRAINQFFPRLLSNFIVIPLGFHSVLFCFSGEESPAFLRFPGESCEQKPVLSGCIGNILIDGLIVARPAGTNCRQR